MRKLGLLTEKEVSAARRMLAGGATDLQVITSLALRCDVSQLHDEIGRIKARWDVRERGHAVVARSHIVQPLRSGVAARPEFPPRNSLTAEICGDPQPGRSALETAQPWRPYESITLAHV